jgi:multidrug resistance efflux pump
VPVKLSFEPGADPDHQLRPGLSATVTVYTK